MPPHREAEGNCRVSFRRLALSNTHSPGTMNRITANRIANQPTPLDQANKESLSAPEILEDLIRRAERANASDIHLQMEGKAATVAFRLDGLMAPAKDLPEVVAERVFGRVKYLARLKTYQESLPQDGRIDKL